MASSNPNPSPPYDMHNLFKPPPPNPNPNHGHLANPNPNPNFYPSPFPNSFPPPTAPFHHPHPFLQYPQSPLPNPNPNPNPGGAAIMSLLSPPLTSASSLPPSTPVFTPILHPTPSAPPVPTVAHVASSKMPRGRYLGTGERAVCDVNVRLVGEMAAPQLEVTPITKYVSDPGLVLGRQIAVNQTYICYGLKMGNVRVLNINTAIRSLFRGHSQRVTDMAFFAEDVHLLASASVDGKIYVWKIEEGPDDDNKPQITGKIAVAIQIVGDRESYHPRICWHSHKQEVLIVAIGNRVLKIDTTKVGRGKVFSAEEPLQCPIDKLIDGIQFIGQHEGDVTDLSISQWMTTRLASASIDGTVKIWDDRKPVPLATLRPHEGHPVNSVAFLTSPHRPEHIVLVTAGPLNREVKLWTSANDEGWLSPSDSETWQCTQTVELRSSAEPRPEEAFFNQVVVLPRASLILLANAKKNAIYAVHVDYGPCPASTRMDYIADFTVTMPILSLTGTSDSLPDGDQVVQIYCVQTQAIQQYALDLSQCLPPPVDALLGRDSGIRVFDAPGSEGFGPTVTVSPKISFPGSSCDSPPTVSAHLLPSVSSDVSAIHERVTSNVEVRPSAPLSSSDAANANNLLSTGPQNIDLAGGLSILRNPSKGFDQISSLGSDHEVNQLVDYQAEGRVDAAVVTTLPEASSVDNSRNDNNLVPNSHLMFTKGANTTHLVTPSEILSGAISSSEITHISQGRQGDEVSGKDKVDNNDAKGVNVEETRLGQHDQSNSQIDPQLVNSDKDKSLSPASEANNEMPKEGHSLTSETNAVEVAQRGDDISAVIMQPTVISEEASESTKDLSGKALESVVNTSHSTPMKGKKQKERQSQASDPSSPALSPFNSTDSINEPGSRASPPPLNDEAFSQLHAMQNTLNQLVSMQKEMQKQMNSMITGPVNKEGKRVETALGRTMEKAVKTNVDALWARFQEENVKHEKFERERMQQLTSLITTGINKDLPSILEKVLKKELSSVGPVLARTVTPVIEKSISSAIADSFQRGVGDKAVNQLEKSVSSKLEATVSRQIQAQFQTSGKQAIQEALRACFESSVIPAFEQSCKSMFEQVDTVFQKGMTEHTTSTQQQFEFAHSPLAVALRDAMNSASSITQNLTSELADGQRKILALVAGNTKALNPMAMQQSNGPMGGVSEMQPLSVQQVEAPLDPTKELSRLISENKFGEAFTMALHRSDVSLVSWLCSKVDLHAICSMSPLPLSQGVLLALLQQLACDISNETAHKVGWMTDVASTINPTDPMIALHVRPIFEQVYNILAHQRSLPSTTPSDASSIRLLLHVINSVLMSCK